MILVVDGLNRHQFRDVLDDMFRLRARVFGGRLGWDVKIENGREIDEFDHLDPAYVIGLDDGGNVVAAVRALQTTGPHMLADVFSAIMDGQAPIRSATLWESTRFCVDTNRLTRSKGKNSVSYATCELMIGSLEYARSAGISDIITVIDPVMDRVLKRSNCAPYDYVGRTVPMGKVSALAALLDCTEERISAVREFAGIHGDVFIAKQTALELLNAKIPAKHLPANQDRKPITDLERYFLEQLNASNTDSERQDVFRLVTALATGFSAERKTVLLRNPRAFVHEA
ncbi:acyl-homoserine-lactone synthase [Ruegeria arenilitoris]|uniref:acyl-homoserine-lactone synthase n=1 Tax=Ruegeria arenilitoris TaxID=1173585 RepID=UPI00147ED775|nr:acyl-homoserine-lactone synthase [Ruegeria arenilitoris]